MRLFAMRLSIVASAVLALLAVAGAANAADIPRAPRYTPPPPPPPPIFTWNGFYVGAHLGGGWQDEDVGPSFTADGFLGGLQAGYNWQFNGPWVVGVEGEFSWTDIKGDTNLIVGGEPHTFSTHVKEIADFAGRFGYAFDRALFYAKGGWAWERADYELVDALTGDISRNGWLVGLGIEYAIWPHVTAKVEWDYIGLGSDDVIVADGDVFHVDSHVNLLKAGLNYKF